MQKGAPPLEAFFFHNFKGSYIPNILHEIYYEKVYDPYLQGKKDLVIIDLGANIGLTSYYFKDFAKIVYSIEPAKNHFNALSEMVKYNNISNIKPIQLAISNETGKSKLYHNDNSTAHSLKDTVNKKDDFEEVETLTLHDFMKRENLEHIDFMKWDTEGMEDVILASDGFKNVASKIDRIVGEFHSWTGISKDLFANTFKDLGFEFNWIPKTEATLYVATKRK